MANQIAILHGWSDTSESFKPLAQFLKDNGYAAVPLWLGDYISLDDDVKVEDVSKRLEAVVQDLIAKNRLTVPFDLIVHSTGGLVARRWLIEYYGERGRDAPVQRLIMLAPANHGSQLATMGKSMIGRLFKGWNNGFQTGTQMLNSLELSSAFQWDLVEREIFGGAGASGKSIYGVGKGLVAPFVITGSHPYTSVRKIVSERGGSDGTVRVAAANMNTHGVTIDFTSPTSNTGAEPDFKIWKRRQRDMEFPLAVLPDRDHASIVNPGNVGKDEVSYSPSPDQRAVLGKLIIEALQCNTSAQYSAIAETWGRGTHSAQSDDSGSGLSERTAALVDDDVTRAAILGDNDPDLANFFHQYFQVNIAVVDDYGDPVPDFFLEFFGGSRLGPAAKVFHDEVLEDVHVNKRDPSRRTLFIDRYDLISKFYEATPTTSELKATINAAAPGPNVTYFSTESMTAKGEFTAHFKEMKGAKHRFLKRNCTHYVKIIIPRIPRPSVFKLTRG